MMLNSRAERPASAYSLSVRVRQTPFRKLLLVWLTVISVIQARAQTAISGTQIRNPLTPVAALPSTCSPYSVYYLISTNSSYICSAANTLTPISAGGAGSTGALQVASGTGGLADSGCTATGGQITCSSGFLSGGPFALTGMHQSAASLASPSSTASTLLFDSGNADHLVRKDSGGRIHDLEVVSIGGYEVGSENATSPLASGDLTSHSIVVNNTTAKTLTEASCVSDNGAQTVTVSMRGNALFTITCVAFGSYSVSPADGSAGYILASSMVSTSVPANAQIDLSGTANGTTKDIKLHIYGAF